MPAAMTSLWRADRAGRRAPTPLAAAPRNPDVVVVGAGITGLSTAVLLARAGRQVVVLEARSVGAGATGNTTGKVSLLQHTLLSTILPRQGRGRTRDYVTANREGQDWLLRQCRDYALPVQREAAYSYAQSVRGLPAARAEYHAGRIGGLDVEWVDTVAEGPVPFPFRGGVRLADQAQIDPMPLLDGMVAEIERRGGHVVEQTRVRKVADRGARCRLAVRGPDGQHGAIDTERLVLATGIPILDRGGYFARVVPHRSYCLAFRVPEPIPRPMFISTDSPTRSLRYAPGDDGDVLIVGGAGHPVGRQNRPSRAVRELADWTTTHFPGAVQTRFWSAQDYTPADGLPYVGPLVPGSDRILVATGFNKWGMSNGAAAALALVGRILGAEPSWAAALRSWSPHELAGVPSALRANLEVGVHLARGWIAPAVRRGTAPGEGEGVVSGPPWRLTARSQVDGVEHRVSPVCPHLGGIVAWNDVDCAWECPLHGSRFAPDGTLLEGPATRGLTPERP